LLPFQFEICECTELEKQKSTNQTGDKDELELGAPGSAFDTLLPFQFEPCEALTQKGTKAQIKPVHSVAQQRMRGAATAKKDALWTSRSVRKRQTTNFERC